MKDRRFRELINLYLDNEINMSEAAELEAELHGNPLRREEYKTYCRLYRGCITLFEKECARAPASVALTRALRDVERRIEHQKSPPFWQRRQWWAYGSALAVAASLTLMVTRVQYVGGLTFALQGNETVPSPLASSGKAPSVPGGRGEAPPLVMAAGAPTLERPVSESAIPLRGISVPGWVLVAAHDTNRPGEIGAASSRYALSMGEPVLNIPDPDIHADFDGLQHNYAPAYEPVPATGLRGPSTALGTSPHYKVEMTSYQFQR